ncbi:MAG: hypothetical protein OHK0039_32840 [Bacteroidia bacterium]
MKKTQGTITYVDISGGFWGIKGDDGDQYAPVNGLPKPLCKEGTRVRVRVEVVQSFGITMWGQDVKVLEIEEV